MPPYLVEILINLVLGIVLTAVQELGRLSTRKNLLKSMELFFNKPLHSVHNGTSRENGFGIRLSFHYSEIVILIISKDNVLK